MSRQPQSQYFIQGVDPIEPSLGYCFNISSKELSRMLLNKAGGGWSIDQTLQAMQWQDQINSHGLELTAGLIVFSKELPSA